MPFLQMSFFRECRFRKCLAIIHNTECHKIHIIFPPSALTNNNGEFSKKMT
jgi:hypothetical protein